MALERNGMYVYICKDIGLISNLYKMYEKYLKNIYLHEDLYFTAKVFSRLMKNINCTRNSWTIKKMIKNSMKLKAHEMKRSSKILIGSII